MAEVIWTKPATKDLQSNYNFIRLDSVLYANREIAEIYLKAMSLQQQIRLGRVVPEYENEKIRELIKDNYRIIYRIRSEEKVSIIRIHHRAKLLRTQF